MSTIKSVNAIRKLISKLLILSFFSLLFFSMTLRANDASSVDEDKEVYQKLDTFTRIMEIIQQEYVDENKSKSTTLIDGAIKGMLQSLDPHSSYLDPDTYKEMKIGVKGEFGGLGIEVISKSGCVKVVSPIDGTPADRKGIQPNDIICKVDGISIKGKTLNEQVKLMRGDVNTDIILTIIRDGKKEPFDVTLTRAKIKVPVVKHKNYESILYVRISSFSKQVNSQLKKEIEKNNDISGIVLDLRNNPGGLLDQAVSVADVFLDKEKIVVTIKKREDKNNEKFKTKGMPMVKKNIPVVVLINAGSASASEIVAGALKDHCRAIIIGQQSFGKGSVQEVIPLANDGALKITIAEYFTPNGHPVNGIGIKPHIKVPSKVIDDRRKMGENKLEDSPTGKLTDGPDPQDKNTVDDPLQKDNVFLYALDHIKLWGNKIPGCPNDQAEE
jgi:carboxyl-terminal processing protease